MAFPGWAFDHRVFLEKKWDYDLIVCDNPDPRAITQEAVDFIGRELPFPLFLLGWSMGGLWINRLFDLPGFSDRIEKAFIVSLPPAFNAPALRKIGRGLTNDGAGSLKRFYQLVFRGNKGFHETFKEKHEAGLLASIIPENLRDQLEVMASERVPERFFTHPKVRLFYSLKDPVVAAGPVLALRPGVFTVPSTHIPLWYDEVVDEINKG